MMLALAVLDLPFKAGPHEEKLEGRQYTVQAGSPLLLFHREIRETTKADEPGAVLVAQHFFRADDRYRHENNEQFDKYVTEEFLPHVVYGAQVVLTNPSGNRQKLQVLLQIPRGRDPREQRFLHPRRVRGARALQHADDRVLLLLPGDRPVPALPGDRRAQRPGDRRRRAVRVQRGGAASPRSTRPPGRGSRRTARRRRSSRSSTRPTSTAWTSTRSRGA